MKAPPKTKETIAISNIVPTTNFPTVLAIFKATIIANIPINIKIAPTDGIHHILLICYTSNIPAVMLSVSPEPIHFLIRPDKSNNSSA